MPALAPHWALGQRGRRGKGSDPNTGCQTPVGLDTGQWLPGMGPGDIRLGRQWLRSLHREPPGRGQELGGGAYWLTPSVRTRARSARTGMNQRMTGGGACWPAPSACIFMWSHTKLWAWRSMK